MPLTLLPIADACRVGTVLLDHTLHVCAEYQGQAPMLRLQNAQAALDLYRTGGRGTTYGETRAALVFACRPATEGASATWTAIHTIRAVLALVEATVHPDNVEADA